MSIEFDSNSSFGCHKISAGIAHGRSFCPMMICVSIERSENGHRDRGRSPAQGHKYRIEDPGTERQRKYDNAPKAIIVKHPDTVLVASCIILDIPMVDRVEPAFYERVSTGDIIHVDAAAGTIAIHKIAD